jgi:phage shock protein C
MHAQDNMIEQGYTPLPLRAHTILGICEGIGEDFGFNPAFLRIPLAASVIVSPLWAFGTYFALGAIVLLSRLLFPRRAVSAVAARGERPLVATNEQRELAKAA